MGANYAAVSDILVLGISLTAQQEIAAEALITQASAKLRNIAKKANENLDELVTDEDYAMAVKSVVVQAVVRALNSIDTDGAAVSQGSETNGQYSISMTYLNAGQSLYFLRNELKELGLKKQMCGFLDVYGTG
jgi:hypothetical protein